MLGATDEEMAAFWQISVPTFYAWQKAHPEFLKALKAGKLGPDMEVAASLHHRALGYSHSAVKIMAVAGEVREVPYTEHYPPDATSAIFWLKNRRPNEWREKIETTSKLVDENDLPVSPLEIARRVAFLLTAGVQQPEESKPLH